MLLSSSAVFVFSGNELFYCPLNLYSSGVLGIAQIIRTLLQQSAGLHFQMDIAGVLNFVFNLPLFFIAYKTMSKNFFVKTLLSVIVQTVFMTFYRFQRSRFWKICWQTALSAASWVASAWV